MTLYNAVDSTDYQNPEDLQIVTLENAIYMNMKNDLAFIIDCRMSMYEHQGSVNPNMPLRYLLYVSREFVRGFRTIILICNIASKYVPEYEPPSIRKFKNR